jgi:leucyl/phenylalanyl-tRNA--protein transferase
VLKFARTPDCEVRMDSDFRAVITACSQVPRPGQDGTWIVDEIIEAYCAWHRLGRAHSVETWVDGELAGGLYFIAIGRMVYGESMFARRTDASKIAVAALVAFCRHHGVAMIDCQQRTGHLASLGGREVPRAEFERRLAQAAAKPDISDWSYDPRMWSRLATPGSAPEDAGP